MIFIASLLVLVFIWLTLLMKSLRTSTCLEGGRATKAEATRTLIGAWNHVTPNPKSWLAAEVVARDPAQPRTENEHVGLLKTSLERLVYTPMTAETDKKIKAANSTVFFPFHLRKSLPLFPLRIADPWRSLHHYCLLLRLRSLGLTKYL